MSDDKNTVSNTALAEPIRKACDLFKLLASHEVHGLAPGEIAKALGVGPPWCSVNLPALAAATGFVERVEDTNRWRLGVGFLRIANTVFASHVASKARQQERENRMNTPL